MSSSPDIEKVMIETSSEPSLVHTHPKVDGNVTVLEADELEGDEGLHKLGYKAELHRGRGFWATLSMSLTCEWKEQ